MKLLVVEDSPRLQRSLQAGLTHEGHAVDVVGDGNAGLTYARTYDYDVVILDLMLPGMSGREVLRRLRADGKAVHVLILSAKDQVDDRVNGLREGADDYLVKPFAFAELCARLDALARRRHSAKNPVLKLRGIEIDTNRRLASREGDPIPLTPTEYALLEILARGAGRVYSKPQLIDLLHPSEADVVTCNVIEVLISGLRKKIHREGEAPIIVTRRGFGYVVESR